MMLEHLKGNVKEIIERLCIATMYSTGILLPSIHYAYLNSRLEI